MSEQKKTIIDLATVELDYNGFRNLAKNKTLTSNEKIGFPDSYRNGFDNHILEDILSKLTNLNKTHLSILDIGPGCSDLSKLLIDFCESKNHKLVFNDSEEMLSFHDDKASFFKIAGMFPNSYNQICNVCNQYDVILCYSVFHYIFIEANVWEFLDKCLTLLKPSGQLLIGDIPNLSKRKRFFSSENGVKYHQEFMKTNEKPRVLYNTVEEKKINDTVLLSLVMRAQAAGFDAYIMPQGNKLPMHNRRDDILIIRP
jgi:SAM-dependent methyltransferase